MPAQVAIDDEKVLNTAAEGRVGGAALASPGQAANGSESVKRRREGVHHLYYQSFVALGFNVSLKRQINTR